MFFLSLCFILDEVDVQKNEQVWEVECAFEEWKE